MIGLGGEESGPATVLARTLTTQRHLPALPSFRAMPTLMPLHPRDDCQSSPLCKQGRVWGGDGTKSYDLPIDGNRILTEGDQWK